MNKRIRRLRAKVKSILQLSDMEVMTWWVKFNPAFDDKKPCELAKTEKGLRKMELIIDFSDESLGQTKEKTNPRQRVDDEIPF